MLRAELKVLPAKPTVVHSLDVTQTTTDHTQTLPAGYRRCGVCGRAFAVKSCPTCQLRREKSGSVQQFTAPSPRQASPPNDSKAVGSEPTPREKVKTPKHQPCIHRGEEIGTMKCGCQGDRRAFRCTKLIRRNVTPVEQALCVAIATSKPFVSIVAKDGSKLFEGDPAEVVVCGKKTCDLYEPLSMS
jgi:hypothetical protein